MSSFPFFRTHPEATQRITWWSIALGCVVIFAVVPLLAQVLISLIYGDTTPEGVPHVFLEVLATSPAFMWAPIVISIPFAVYARVQAIFGWGTSLAIGTFHGVLSVPILFQLPLDGERVPYIWVVTILLFGIFWLTIRFIHPSAFPASSQKG